MHPILQELHQDHLNLSRVLELLQKQLDLICGGGQVNLHVLGEIVDYVRSYPDLIHHPREDVIFQVYRERCAGSTEVIDRLMDEHRTLIAGTAELQACVDQWQHDSPLPRGHIAGLIAEYLRRQWDHLNLEEGSAYKLLAERLGEGDWAHIEVVMPRGSDPLFGDLMQRRYQHIYDQVITYA
jgi:hemerythrin-like domain-containing protein